MNVHASPAGAGEPAAPMQSEAAPVAPATPTPDTARAIAPIAASFTDLARSALDGIEHIQDQQVMFSRAMFDCWLRLARELSDTGRHVCSPSQAIDRMTAVSADVAGRAEGTGPARQ